MFTETVSIKLVTELSAHSFNIWNKFKYIYFLKMKGVFVVTLYAFEL